jgi:periodic tryptophan protein 1
MITTTAWVRRGVAAQFPTKYEIDEDEINRISELARLQLEDAKGDLKAAKEGGDEDAMDEETDEKAAKGTGKSSTWVLSFIFVSC